MAKMKDIDFHLRSDKLNKALERYGVEGASFGGKPGNYGSDRGVRTADQVRDELTKAASQDYDTRRTLEAAALSGKKKAKDILDSGFKKAGDVMNAQNFFEKAAKRHGQGGEFSNVSDFMGLTQSMVERDRRSSADILWLCRCLRTTCGRPDKVRHDRHALWQRTNARGSSSRVC